VPHDKHTSIPRNTPRTRRPGEQQLSNQTPSQHLRGELIVLKIASDSSRSGPVERIALRPVHTSHAGDGLRT
jgi:hypothetical protein